MSPEHVGEVEKRRPAGRARVDNRENRLKKAIEVTRRGRPPAELQQVLARIPPTVDDSRRKHGGLASVHHQHLVPTAGAKRARRYDPFLTLARVDMSRRPIGMWWQTAFDPEDHLTGIITNAAQPKGLPGVAICQVKEAIHATPNGRGHENREPRGSTPQVIPRPEPIG